MILVREFLKNSRRNKQNLKRLNNLYSKIYDLENIKLAHKNARKNKTFYKEVKMVDDNPEFHFSEIEKMLKDKTFKNSNYEIFKKIEGGKEREIYKLPYFPDRVIHHAILQILEPIWIKTLISDTFACIKNRGIHKGFKRVKNSLKDIENTKYCLKCDIKKFYPSINHDILKEIIRKKIKDKDLLELLDEIINSTNGIPIGNYLSQHFGNLYLSEFDHWIKETHKCKYYFRYCDDFIILHSDKKFLHEKRKEIENYLREKLDLKLKENWQIFPVAKRGIDFLGYRFFHNYILLRKSISKRIKKKILYIKKNYLKMKPIEIISSIMSYYGWVKHANRLNFLKSILDDKIKEIINIQCNILKIKNPLRKIYI